MHIADPRAIAAGTANIVAAVSNGSPALMGDSTDWSGTSPNISFGDRFLVRPTMALFNESGTSGSAMAKPDILLEDDRITVIGIGADAEAGDNDIEITTDMGNDADITLNPDWANVTIGGRRWTRVGR